MSMRAMILTYAPSPFRGMTLPAAYGYPAYSGTLTHSANDLRCAEAVGFSGVDARGGWIGLPGFEQTAQLNARGASSD